MKGTYTLETLKEKVVASVLKHGPGSERQIQQRFGLDAANEQDRVAVWKLNAAIVSLIRDRGLVKLDHRYWSLEVR